MTPPISAAANPRYGPMTSPYIGASAASNFMFAPDTPTIGMPGKTLITIADKAANIAMKATSLEESFNRLPLYFCILVCRFLHNVLIKLIAPMVSLEGCTNE